MIPLLARVPFSWPLALYSTTRLPLQAMWLTLPQREASEMSDLQGLTLTFLSYAVTGRTL